MSLVLFQNIFNPKYPLETLQETLCNPTGNPYVSPQIWCGKSLSCENNIPERQNSEDDKTRNKYVTAPVGENCSEFTLTSGRVLRELISPAN